MLKDVTNSLKWHKDGVRNDLHEHFSQAINSVGWNRAGQA